MMSSAIAPQTIFFATPSRARALFGGEIFWQTSSLEQTL
jgi:hypothetical protein